MVIAHPEHKIRTRRTDLSAVLEQLNVIRGCMLSSHRQTMTDGFQADCMAAQTIVDAFTHFLTDFLMWHKFFLLSFDFRFD
jgi:hypothetical protein